jgi:hypothetical protein
VTNVSKVSKVSNKQKISRRMSRNDYRPVHLSEDHHHDHHNYNNNNVNDIEHSHSHMNPVTTKNDEQKQIEQTEQTEPILMAVAIPDSIRPPKVSYIDNPTTNTNTTTTTNHTNPNNANISNNSNTIQSLPKLFLRRILILIIGLILTYLTFLESLLLIIFGYANYAPIELILGLLWFGATLGVLLGSLIGAFKGQWRFLVPGLVLQYVVNILTKVLVTDLPDDNSIMMYEQNGGGK